MNTRLLVLNIHAKVVSFTPVSLVNGPGLGRIECDSYTQSYIALGMEMGFCDMLKRDEMLGFVQCGQNSHPPQQLFMPVSQLNGPGLGRIECDSEIQSHCFRDGIGVL